MKTVVLVVLLSLLAMPTLAYDWVVNPANGHRYTVVDCNSWTEARNSAIAFGGDLVIINDEAENTWVHSTLFSLSPGHWAAFMGLYQPIEEISSPWVWVDGQSVDYINWDTGQPSGDGSYGLMFEENGKWNDGTLDWYHAIAFVEIDPLLSPPNYQFVNLGRGEGLAINDLNWMTGCRYDVNGIYHPMFWTDDAGFIDLPTEANSIGRDINNIGEIIGYGSGNGIHWSVLENSWQYFNGTGGAAHPLAINDSGKIVGYTKNADTSYDSILWNNLDSPQVIGDLGGENSWAYDINENDVVVGEKTTPMFLHRLRAMVILGARNA